MGKISSHLKHKNSLINAMALIKAPCLFSEINVLQGLLRLKGKNLILERRKIFPLTLKIADFANSLDLDEVALNEPPHLDLVFAL